MKWLLEIRINAMMHSIKAHMFDWNVSLSPLDGAVVEKREGGGSSLCADVNKNSHFKPVCALTDHSKHYARHRGWTTLGYSTESILHRARRDADKADRAPLQVLFTFRVLTFCGDYSHLGVMSRQLCHRATTHLFICYCVGERGVKKMRGGALLE